MQPLSPFGCTTIFTVATLLVAISAFGLLPLDLQLIFSITDYRHMTAMLIFLNSHFYHITPQLETLQSVPHCPLTLLHVDHFFLNAFMVLNQNISITTFLFSFIILSSVPVGLSSLFSVARTF